MGIVNITRTRYARTLVEAGLRNTGFHTRGL